MLLSPQGPCLFSLRPFHILHNNIVAGVRSCGAVPRHDITIMAATIPWPPSYPTWYC